ncbi:MAG: DHA2 family efflux MFS transporter permease subunit [Candidatus Dormibacteria bacterium]
MSAAAPPSPRLEQTAAGGLAMGTAAGRWVLLATVLGSGIAFLDSTVVNVALPALGADLHASFTDLEWVLDAYLLLLSSFVLLGGSLGDLFGRRLVFVVGMAGFGLASAACGLAPSPAVLIGARGVQGLFAALLVPGSLAILSAGFRDEDRGRAVGAWSGLGGVAAAIGPILGGYLVDAVSWRWVFFINLPLVAGTLVIVLRHVPESRDPDMAGLPPLARLDIRGAVFAAAGLGLVVYPLIEGPRAGGLTPALLVSLVVGTLLLGTFIPVEMRARHPMVPLGLFRSRDFSVTNLTTVSVYAALGGALFIVVLQLQRSLGYSALGSGVALLPITALLLTLSSRTGALAARVGPRLPMSAGPLLAAAGLLLMTRVQPGATYVGSVLPAVIVFGVGLSLTVAPLTATVLGAVDTARAGAASGINNGVARVAGLLAVALIPLLSGLSTAGGGRSPLPAGSFTRAMVIGAGLCAVGGLVALFGLGPREGAVVGAATAHPRADGKSEQESRPP